MSSNDKRCRGITKAAWGYFFVYFNINLNGVSILPAFIGYILFLSAIGDLEEEERELSLLRTIGILLVLWHIFDWISTGFKLASGGVLPFVDILVCLINLYFHFQLLTNLASIAARYQGEGDELDERLLRYRTAQTVLLTIVTIVDLLANATHDFASDELVAMWEFVSVGLAIVYLIASICLMRALFALRKCMTETEMTV